MENLKSARLSCLLIIFLGLNFQVAQAQWKDASNLKFVSAPELKLANLSGKQINISDYRGKTLLVNFWATWCEPCTEEFEELIYLQDKYAPKGLVVLAVNLAEMKPRIQQFLKNNLIKENAIEILQDRNSIVYKSWKARGIPTTFLIDKNGIIVGSWIGTIANAESAEFKNKVESLLNKN